MTDILTYGLLSFTSLFTLINPIGILPMYLSLTEGIKRDDRTLINRKGILFAAIILVIFAFLGNMIFQFYGITIHSFRIVGGILFFRVGLNMLESKTSRTKTTPKEEEEAINKDIFAYTPFGMPIIAGPGSITSIMIFSSSAETYLHKVTLVITLVLVLFISYNIFQFSGRLSTKLGTIGLRILQRIMGLLLMVIAIEFIIDGLTPIVRSWI